MKYLIRLVRYIALVALVIVTSVSSQTHANVPKQEITINPGKYFNYYHIQLDLIPNQYRVNERYGFNPGGQFEVFIPKELFPIPAPNCREHIIVRMPYSNNTHQKKALFERLSQSKETTRVTLELNPYLNIVTESPLALELTYCNVFFRHKHGDYYNKPN
ncbi:hypothetical protein [Thalassotalea euphylliae]|uniref:Uncharacterized protein n=1 Tax=Thalassotalea euphylliae TaxID=1655234 RepID=A0A3E0UES2_9GAMM|nr:hypothetical protein [Thalassotalea euphylliae]REL35057.1 hypothetical protein DXX92_06580 [Thalassotalea euphylliae]